MRLPSEFPEGPAEVIVIASPQQATPDVDAALDMTSARRAAIGRYDSKAFYIADDFNASLPNELLEAFEGGIGGAIGIPSIT